MTSAAPRPKLREDIQVLRAIAVVLVVVFHFFPKALPGGYVGVDVFFAISGYLITAHLLKEIDKTGSVSLSRFWAQRARRLLPASLAVLGVTLLLGQFLLPISAREDLAFDTAAASGYVLNLRLAKQAVDYMAQDNLPSPVQHYWSLSTEEQFYFVWPVLLSAAVWLARKRSTETKKAFFLATVVLVGLASLVYSITHTAFHKPSAYFLTTTRAHEFALGALLSFAGKPIESRVLGSVLLWSGLVAIALSALLFSESSSFPGYLALVPTVGAVLALRGGEVAATSPSVRALARPPVLRLGDLSYSVYLWHWPFLILARAHLGRDLHVTEACALIGVTLGVSLLSERFLENAVRYSAALLARPPRFTFVGALAGMLVVFGFALASARVAKAKTAERDPLAIRLKSHDVPCFGARVFEPECSRKNFPGRLIPAPYAAKGDHGKGCMTNNESAKMTRCSLGTTHRPRGTVALIGDSHAGHFQPMLDKWAKRNELKLETYLKGSCPLSAAKRATALLNQKSCEQWKSAVWRELEAKREVSIAFLSASSLNPFVTSEGRTPRESALIGYREAISRLENLGVQVVVLRDVPRPRPDVIQCLERLGTNAAMLVEGACSRPRSESLLPDPLADAGLATKGATVLDFSDVFCDDRVCRPVVGNALVYRDPHHITGTFARTLEPRFAKSVPKLTLPR